MSPAINTNSPLAPATSQTLSAIQVCSTPQSTNNTDFQIQSTQSTPSSLATPSPHHVPVGLRGIVPQHMIDLFVTPILNNKQKKNTRIITTERVITSDEYRDILVQKLAKEKEEAEAKERRKLLREDKKKTKESKKNKTSSSSASAEEYQDMLTEMEPSGSQPEATRRSSRPNKRLRYNEMLNLEESSTDSSDSSESLNEDDLCKICDRRFPPKSRKQRFVGKRRSLVRWIFCETCCRWMHNSCEGATLDDLAKDIYTCKGCKSLD